ncbi:hypothetical protein KI387_029697 [Taxus chinensis]|uniref:Uncharacterized protein n=1 Tax=Taxus chinensis TaxID=29808 RepID=A0AA38FDH6_TAXCH|nr:hypothetical protein KI387_029697 [Taxus chinensis]
MVITRGNVVNNPPPKEGASTTQKLNEILAALLDTRDHLAILEQQVMGNEEEEDTGNNNQPPPEDNANLGFYNNNVNIIDQPENKKARLAIELTNDIRRISLTNFDGTTLGDGAKN